MPDPIFHHVYWTEQALENAKEIQLYLSKNFSATEVNNFYEILISFEKVISVFPKLYPTSIKNKKVHRGVLTREMSVFYRIKKNKIEVLALLDNRCDHSK